MAWNVRFNAVVSKNSYGQLQLRYAGETRLRVVCRIPVPPADNYRSMGCLQLMRYDPSPYFAQLLVLEQYELTRDGIFVPAVTEAGHARIWIYNRKYLAAGYQILLATENY